jgi:protoporphyrinogen oxidase
MRSVKVLVIGAGPCGLGAALELTKHRPDDFLVVDPAESPGGSASSVTTEEGFTFDLGWHMLFPHKRYSEFRDLIQSLPIEWHQSLPVRGVWIRNRFLPYPAQRNLHRLPVLSMVRALASISMQRMRNARVRVTGEEQPGGDLDAYLNTEFGGYLKGLLMGPINQKQWAHSPKFLSDVWVRQRSGSETRNVAQLRIRRTLRNLLLNGDDVGWSKDEMVLYPSQGGAGAIWSAIGARIPRDRMMLGRHVKSISLAQKTVVLDNDETIRWESMISTMPLDTLLRCIDDDPALREKADRLVRARAHLFGFGMQGAVPADYDGMQTCHVVDADAPFWRVSFPMAVSRGNGPHGCFSVLCEVSEAGASEELPIEKLEWQVVGRLVRMGLLTSRGTKVISRWHTTLKHGYPVPFLGRDEVLEDIQPQLEAHGIYSRGRFGAWRYEISNQDHTFMQGTEAVRRIIFGTREETIDNAPAVNDAGRAKQVQIKSSANAGAASPQTVS